MYLSGSEKRGEGEKKRRALSGAVSIECNQIRIDRGLTSGRAHASFDRLDEKCAPLATDGIRSERESGCKKERERER